MSDNFAGTIERGRARPTLATVARMAEALQVRLGDLFLEGDAQRGRMAETLQDLERLLQQRGPEDAESVLAIAKEIFTRYPGGQAFSS